MVRLNIALVLLWTAGHIQASPSPASPAVAAPLMGIRTRNIPGTSDEDTLHEVWRRLVKLAHRKRETVFENSTSIDKSWTDAVLFSQSFAPNTSSVEGLEVELGVEVTCATCYVKGGATAKLAVNGDFDFGDTIKNVTEQIADEFKNLTKTTFGAIKQVMHNVGEEVLDLFDDDETDGFDLDNVFDFNNLTIDTDIDVDLPPLPEVQLLFQIDSLDLYVAIDITIAAQSTFTLPLYRSQTPLGITAGEGLEIGVFVTMDLILSVEGELSLRTGFHLLLEDPVGFNIALFSSNVSEVIFNGGKFEFLPVTILSGNVALKAILRVGMHAGMEISTIGIDIPVPERFEQDIDKVARIGAGVEVGVFAHVAEFLTNITGGADLAAEEGCGLKIVEEYTLAVGAVAGATVAFGDHTWGPQPNTTVPIFYTTLADVCAVTVDIKTTTNPTNAPSLPTSKAPNRLAARLPQQSSGDPDADLETRTLTTTIHQTGIACASPALAAVCPNSLRTTSVLTTVRTLVTAVPSGAKNPPFPAPTADTVASTIPLGKGANKLAATSGAPVSYVPPPPPPTSSSETTSAGPGGGGGIGDVVDDIGKVFQGETGGVSTKLIIGLSVGLGLPLAAAAIASFVHCLRRRRYAPLPVSGETAVEYTGGYQSPMAAERESMLKKSPAVAVGEVENR